MNKKWIIGIVVLVLIVLIIVGIALILNKKDIDDNVIPNDYIAIFHGGLGEITYETYIYKIDNGKPNYGFKYINVTSTTEYWGSSNVIRKVTEKGEFDWTDGAFTTAEKNHAYSYVTVPNDSYSYSIEEFQNRFIMN